MKKIFTIMISVFCIFSSTIAFSQDEKKADMGKSSTVKTAITKEEILNCQNISGSIRKGMNELGECWKDSDCLIVNFGCPWQEGPCHHSLAGKDEQDKFDEINKQIFAFNKTCLPKSPDLVKRCDAYKKATAKVKCSAQPLSCLNGRCVTRTELMLQEIGVRRGSYGYKKEEAKEEESK